MKISRSSVIVFILSVLVCDFCAAENIYGLIGKSKDGYYFHTKKQITHNTRLKLVSANIDVDFLIPLERRKQTETGDFYFHSTYAYKIEKEEAHKLDSLGRFYYPAIVLNNNGITRFKSDSIVSSLCTSSEGVHHSIWEKADTGFEKVWSMYVYVGYELESNCYEWELGNIKRLDQ